MKFFENIRDSFRGIHIAKFGDKYIVRRVTCFGLLEEWYAWYPRHEQISAVRYDHDYHKYPMSYTSCLFDTFRQANMIATLAQIAYPKTSVIDKD